MQPAVDGEGNVLLWNGEVFGCTLVSADAGAAPPPGPEENDTDAVLTALGAWDASAGTDERDPEAAGQHVRCAHAIEYE